MDLPYLETSAVRQGRSPRNELITPSYAYLLDAAIAELNRRARTRTLRPQWCVAPVTTAIQKGKERRREPGNGHE